MSQQTTRLSVRGWTTVNGSSSVTRILKRQKMLVDTSEDGLKTVPVFGSCGPKYLYIFNGEILFRYMDKSSSRIIGPAAEVCFNTFTWNRGNADDDDDGDEEQFGDLRRNIQFLGFAQADIKFNDVAPMLTDSAAIAISGMTTTANTGEDRILIGTVVRAIVPSHLPSDATQAPKDRPVESSRRVAQTIDARVPRNVGVINTDALFFKAAMETVANVMGVATGRADPCAYFDILFSPPMSMPKAEDFITLRVKKLNV